MPWKEWDVTGEQTGKGLVVTDFVTKVAKDPTELPDCFVVEGWLGQSPRENVFRVYLNYALSEYLEILDEDIIYAEPVAEGAFARLRVWVKRGAHTRHIVQRLQRAEVAYLAGDIADQADWPAHPKGEWGPEPTKCSQCYGSH